MPLNVLVLYDSHGPQISHLAEAISEGAAQVGDTLPVVKHIDDADRTGLISADALILGSPNWSGITGFLKRWLEDSMSVSQASPLELCCRAGQRLISVVLTSFSAFEAGKFPNNFINVLRIVRPVRCNVQRTF